MTKTDLKQRVKECGSHYFDRDTMRFFNSKLEGVYEGPNGAYFVTSEVPPGGSRKYTVRLFDEAKCRVATIPSHAEGFLKYATKNDAAAEARRLAGCSARKGSHGRY